MSKQPYIPLYIGDWEKDTNCLTPMAEFALLKLTFKLFNSPKRGVFLANYRLLSTLFKTTIDETKLIFDELIFNNVLEIEVGDGGIFTIKSRRMMREVDISEKRSAIGKKGGSKTQAKVKQTSSKQSSKSEAKLKQNPDIDNDIDNDIKSEDELKKEAEFEIIFDRWLKFKKAKKQTYVDSDSRQTAFKKLVKFSRGDPAIAKNIIEEAIGNNWAGFFEPKDISSPTPKKRSYVA